MEELRLWAPAIFALISTVSAVWAWMTSPAKAASAAADAASAAAASVAERVNSVERRLDKVEFVLEHVPEAETIQELALAVSDMRGDVKTLTAQVKIAVGVSERLQSWLLEQGK